VKHIKRMERKRVKHIINHQGSKSETLRSKTNCLVRESEVKKVLLVNKSLYLLYCKNIVLIANHSNELVVLANVEFLFAEM